MGDCPGGILGEVMWHHLKQCILTASLQRLVGFVFYIYMHLHQHIYSAVLTLMVLSK